MFSDPVVGNKFFGRNKALALLAKRVDGLKDGYRQNIAIVGPKLIGKSSLILHFFSNFSQNMIIPIYIDLTPNSFHHFIYKFIGALLYHYLKSKNLELTEELESLKKNAQATIPKTVETISSIENSMKNLNLDQAYQTILSLTTIFKQESGISCIVVLDEFHLLNSYKIRNPFSNFAKEIMMQKDTMYIFISSQLRLAKRILGCDLSLLFGNFEIIHLEPFGYNTCCKFLEKRFQNINLPQNSRDFLIAFSERYPFYLDILSNKIVEKAKQYNKTEISRGIIAEAFNSLMYDSRGILNQYFTSFLSHNLNGADYANFMPILLSVTERGRQINAIAKTTKRQLRITSKQIGYLLDKDLLSKVGVFYRIQDRIFRFWLKSVYRRKHLSLAANLTTESSDFSKEIEREILNFSYQTKRKIIERVIDLFKSFDNEIVMLQNKSFKFWKFEEIRAWPKTDLQDSVFARYKNGYWVCLIKTEETTEDEIHKLLDYCKKTKYKIRQIVIISFKELDLNVRLMVLEKRGWIWSLENLNLLLDVYGKQQIIK